MLWLAPFTGFAAAPDVALKDLDGKTRNVNEYIGKGKWTVVAVWSADCPICRRDIHHMAFLHDQHRKKDVQVLGLSIDTYAQRAKAREFIDDQILNFPNLIGDYHDAGRLGNGVFIGTPTYYVYSPQGKFMTQRVGPVTQEQMEQLIASLRGKKG
jgi:peroxiredoxin